MHATRYQPDGPSPLRWAILLLLFAGFTLNIVDRQALSLAAPVIREQFHLSSTQYGFLVFAFLFGMVLGQIPAGLLFDRKGPRFGFSFVVTRWSLANLMHAFAGSPFYEGALSWITMQSRLNNFPDSGPGPSRGCRMWQPSTA